MCSIIPGKARRAARRARPIGRACRSVSSRRRRTSPISPAGHSPTCLPRWKRPGNRRGEQGVALRSGQKIKVQKLIERCRLVAAKRLATDEAVLAIERERRLKGLARAGLEAQPTIAALVGNAEHMIEQR